MQSSGKSGRCGQPGTRVVVSDLRNVLLAFGCGSRLRRHFGRGAETQSRERSIGLNEIRAGCPRSPPLRHRRSGSRKPIGTRSIQKPRLDLQDRRPRRGVFENGRRLWHLRLVECFQSDVREILLLAAININALHEVGHVVEATNLGPHLALRRQQLAELQREGVDAATSAGGDGVSGSRPDASRQAETKKPELNARAWDKFGTANVPNCLDSPSTASKRC